MVIFSIFSKSGKKVENIFCQTVSVFNSNQEKKFKSRKKVKIKKKSKRSGKKEKNIQLLIDCKIFSE